MILKLAKNGSRVAILNASTGISVEIVDHADLVEAVVKHLDGGHIFHPDTLVAWPRVRAMQETYLMDSGDWEAGMRVARKAADAFQWPQVQVRCWQNGCQQFQQFIYGQGKGVEEGMLGLMMWEAAWDEGLHTVQVWHLEATDCALVLEARLGCNPAKLQDCDAADHYAVWEYAAQVDDRPLVRHRELNWAQAQEAMRRALVIQARKTEGTSRVELWGTWEGPGQEVRLLEVTVACQVRC